jgi:type IV secretory pathway VirB10-like protein
MTEDPNTPSPSDVTPEAGVQAKEPPPGLTTRAPRPTAVRLRKSVVQAIAIGGVVLVSGSLAWAFVVQPELKAGERARAAEAREDEARGVVRPTDAVTDQPASYDRLPEPRTGVQPPVVEAGDPAEPAGTAAARPAGPLPRSATPAQPRGPRPAEVAARSVLFFAEAPGQAAAQVGASSPAPPTEAGLTERNARGADYGATYNGHVLTAPLSPYELKAGAMIPATLLTAVDTSRSGPVIATVSQNVYDSISGRHLVIPQGARLIGRHEGESAYGDRRAFLSWERLILPNGKSLVLTSEPGVDAQGAVGVRGQVDRRLLPLLVGTVFAGAITTLGQLARDDDGARSGGILGDAGDAAAIEGARVGGRLIDRELEVRPSIRLNAGAPVRAMITRDLILEPYRP